MNTRKKSNNLTNKKPKTHRQLSDPSIPTFAYDVPRIGDHKLELSAVKKYHDIPVMMFLSKQ